MCSEWVCEFEKDEIWKAFMEDEWFMKDGECWSVIIEGIYERWWRLKCDYRRYLWKINDLWKICEFGMWIGMWLWKICEFVMWFWNGIMEDEILENVLWKFLENNLWKMGELGNDLEIWNMFWKWFKKMMSDWGWI